MLITNRHQRTLRDVNAAAELLDSLGSGNDRLWPVQRWPPLRLDSGLEEGSKGGHGPIQYWVDCYEPGKRVRFRFLRPKGFDGFHEFRVLGAGSGGGILVHVVDVEADWRGAILWYVALRSLHDALIEDALDRAELQANDRIVRPTVWSTKVRFLRGLLNDLPQIVTGANPYDSTGSL